MAAKKEPCCVPEDILLNGAPQQAHFKSAMGYGVQDDNMMGTLMLRENGVFSSLLGHVGSQTKKK